MNTNSISQLRELATFSAREQRYVRQSLDVARYEQLVTATKHRTGEDKIFIRQSLEAGQAEESVFSKWSRDESEKTIIRAQMKVYENVPGIHHSIPRDFICGPDIANFMGPLVYMSAFDLGRAYIESFSAYRYLYERIFQAVIRPWLPAAFCAAAAMPSLEPEWRKKLLQSLSSAAAAAPGWSLIEPTVQPVWIEDNKTN